MVYVVTVKKMFIVGSEMLKMVQAGVMFGPQSEIEDGLESQLASYYHGHFLLTRYYKVFTRIVSKY